MLYQLTGNCCSFDVPVQVDWGGGRLRTIVRRAAEFRPVYRSVPLVCSHSFQAWVGIDVTVTRQRDHLRVDGVLDSRVEVQARAIEAYFAGWFRGLSMYVVHGRIEEVSLCAEPRDKTTWVRLESVGEGLVTVWRRAGTDARPAPAVDTRVKSVSLERNVLWQT